MDPFRPFRTLFTIGPIMVLGLLFGFRLLVPIILGIVLRIIVSFLGPPGRMGSFTWMRRFASLSTFSAFAFATFALAATFGGFGFAGAFLVWAESVLLPYLLGIFRGTEFGSTHQWNGRHFTTPQFEEASATNLPMGSFGLAITLDLPIAPYRSAIALWYGLIGRFVGSW